MESTIGDPSKWEWIPCNYDFKQATEDGTEVFYNLGPSITLSNPKGNGKEPKIEIKIESEKNFIYSEELGWNWHKSWNIPNLKVTVDITDPDTGERLVPPKNLSVHIFAVKAMIEILERFHLLDVGIKGENKKIVTENEAYFSALKFASTSYNNDSVKFHLAISVQVDADDDDSPRILNSFISPPVFVDSRKSARDTEKIKAKRVSSLIDPFLPENLDKVFVKRENRRKDCHQEEITNSIEGLINYFTAPNIRHKVKHPLFLTIKFSNCISLYYNTNILKTDQEDKLVENIQNLLYESQLSTGSQKPAKIDKAPLIMVLKNVCPSQNVKSKKIMEHLESIQNDSLQILYDTKIIPSNFKEISNINDLKARYKKIYAVLASSKFKIMSNFAKEKGMKVNEDELDDGESNDEQSEASTSVANKSTKEPQRMMKIPISSQQPSRTETAPKGGLEKPKISQYEQQTSKKVKMEHSDLPGVKTEDDMGHTTGVLPNTRNQGMGALPGLNSGMNGANSDISSQLELMNKLLMINAMIGMNQQQPPQTQQQQTSQMPLSTQQLQTLGSFMQRQNLQGGLDLGQLGNLSQEILGGLNPMNNLLSGNERASTPFRGMNTSNAVNPSFNLNSRPTDQMLMSRFQTQPSSQMQSQNELQKMLMQQMNPQLGAYNPTSQHQLMNAGMQSMGPATQGISGLQQSLTQQTNQAMNMRNLLNANLLSYPKMSAGMPNIPMNNIQDPLRHAYSTMSWKPDLNADYTQKNGYGVKEEDRVE